MLLGARQGKLSALRRLVAAAMARDLSVFVVPGLDIARAHGLNIEAAGLHLVVSPRHASVLLVVGTLSSALRESAAVVYAQMMRPRVVFVLGTQTDEQALSPLPAADVAGVLSQQDLIEGVHQLRRLFAENAFRSDVVDFDASVLQVRIEYTCPMHPEVVRDEPGSCPKCGMNLVPREARANMEQTAVEQKNTDAGAKDMQATATDTHDAHQEVNHEAAVEYSCPMHPEVVQSEPGSCPRCGMNLEPREVKPEPTDEHRHRHMTQEATVEYTCPMHPEVVQSEPGSCPKCGMNLEPREVKPEPADEHRHRLMTQDAAVEYTCPMHPEVVRSEPGSCPKCGMDLVPRDTHDTQHHGHTGMNAVDDHANMDHASRGHSGMNFMSMVEVTKDLPRSTDGLPMEWIDVPFGPFFPGLPGGLLLSLTLDGDAVAGSGARFLTEGMNLLSPLPTDSADFVEQLANMDPLTPVAYRLLACRALEDAAGMEVPAGTARARAGALERERISSHLGWLALFAQQTGFDWLMRRAGSLQLEFQHASLEQIVALKPAIHALIKRLRRTPLLKSRTVGIGRLTPQATLRGPVARAAGMPDDARSADRTFTALGFTPARRSGGDVFARLHLRLDEITHSLMLIEAAGAVEWPTLLPVGEASGTGDATVETARGPARLQLTLESGQIKGAQLETPSTPHLDLIEPLMEQQELGDALVAVGSLDLSPWSSQQAFLQ